jgi:hypothetical protein
MPIPPRPLKELVEGTLDHYASQAWPQLEEVTIRWRGSYGYLRAWWPIEWCSSSPGWVISRTQVLAAGWA